jgi:hypothetical protein
MKGFNTITKTEIISRIKFMIKNPKDYNLDMFLNVYNRWQEDEHNGVDYIFNINNPDDLIDCIKGGLTADEIANFVDGTKDWSFATPYFLFGCNHNLLPLIYPEICGLIINNLNDIVDCIIAYPWVEEYRAIYVEVVTNRLLGEY